MYTSNFLFLYNRRLMNAAGADGADGGSGTEGAQPPAEKTYTQGDVDKMVAGLKTKNGEVIADNKKLKEQLARFEGIDPDAVKAVLQNFADTEEAKLIAEGKINEVLDKRTERMKAAHDKELQAAVERAEAAEARAAKFIGRVLGDAVRTAGTEANLHKTAFDDALLRAQTAFEINDDGEAVAKDGVLGKDGQPLTLKEWFEGMKETAPHWFPAPSGGGTTGNGTVPAGIKRSQMNATEKRNFIEKHGQDAYLKLPK